MLFRLANQSLLLEIASKSRIDALCTERRMGSKLRVDGIRAAYRMAASRALMRREADSQIAADDFQNRPELGSPGRLGNKLRLSREISTGFSDRVVSVDWLPQKDR